MGAKFDIRFTGKSVKISVTYDVILAELESEIRSAVSVDRELLRAVALLRASRYASRLYPLKAT